MAKLLTLRRFCKNYGQSKLAQDLKISEALVSEWMHLKKSPSLQTAWEIHVLSKRKVTLEAFIIHDRAVRLNLGK